MKWTKTNIILLILFNILIYGYGINSMYNKCIEYGYVPAEKDCYGVREKDGSLTEKCTQEEWKCLKKKYW